jgi:hypothetical protein
MKPVIVHLLIPEDKVEPKLISLGATIGVAGLLFLFLIFFVNEMPDPPLPAEPEPMEFQIELSAGSGLGENSTNPGGSSEGNSGETGSTAEEQLTPNPNPTPPANGAITGTDPDNPSATSSSQPSKALENALAAFNQKKGKAVINITGGGQGNDPYNGGLGGNDGNGIGPGENSPGKDGPGPGGVEDGTGGGKRKVVSRPEVKNPTLEEGVVAVDVYVDRNGKVVRTETNSARSTTINTILQATARQEAAKIVFSPAPNGPVQQLFTIEFNFTLK